MKRTQTIGLIFGCITTLIPLTTFAAFDSNLSIGSHGAAVVELQNFLISQGLLTGVSTGYFGPLTRDAVKAFQGKNAITPVSGYFGPRTRSMAEILDAATHAHAFTKSSWYEDVFSATTSYDQIKPVPLKIQFYSYTGYCGNNPIDCNGGYFLIDFGDGSSTTPFKLWFGCDGTDLSGNCGIDLGTHTYPSAGNYNAVLRECASATDTVCSKMIASKTVTAQ